MIGNDDELNVTLERIARLQQQVVYARKTESNPINYQVAASGFLAEVDRMQVEVKEYLMCHPSDFPPQRATA